MKFEDIARKPYRWPRKGDLPFKQAVRAETAGSLTTDGLTRTVSIMDGFMHAGAALADLVLKERLRQYDLVYPMLHCYRHAVETGLKWLIKHYGPRVGVKPQNLNVTHNLLCLWQYFERIIEACGEQADADALMATGKIIRQFHDWDKGGMKFRYAISKTGTVDLFQYENIDIENLKDVMDGVANFFDGSDGWLDSNTKA